MLKKWNGIMKVLDNQSGILMVSVVQNWLKGIQPRPNLEETRYKVKSNSLLISCNDKFIGSNFTFRKYVFLDFSSNFELSC